MEGKLSYVSYAVQTRRAKVPDHIRYFFIRALMSEITLKVAPMSPWQREKMTEEFYRRVATLMLLDWYSATHPFDHEDVELEPTRYNTDLIKDWWSEYRHMAPDLVVDYIWGE